MFRKLAFAVLICSAAFAQSAIYNFSGLADDSSGRTFNGHLSLDSADFWVGSSQLGIYNLTGMLTVTVDGATYSHALTTGKVWNDLGTENPYLDQVAVYADNLHLTFQSEGSKTEMPTVLTSTAWPGQFLATDWSHIGFDGLFPANAGSISGTVNVFNSVPEPTGFLPLLIGIAALRRRKNRRS